MGGSGWAKGEEQAYWQLEREGEKARKEATAAPLRQ